MNNKEIFSFNIGVIKNIPGWIQWSVFIAILGIIAFYYLKIPELKPTGKMQSIADSILHGDVSSKSRAIWELQNESPEDAASVINILIDMIGDETAADPGIARKYHERKEKLAGSLADYYNLKSLTVGDLAAFSIRRIKQNLVVETSGDGGPTTTLVAVRKTLSKRVVPMLSSGNDMVRIRIIKEILPGDADPYAMDTIISFCLNDPSPEIRAYSAALFITYAHADKEKTYSAIPKIINLIDDPDIRVSSIAHQILKTISGTDMGTNADSWKGWFNAKRQR